MRRREFVAVLGGAAAWSHAARAQSSRSQPARVGYAAMGRPEGHLPTAHARAFHAALESLGWRAERNLHIEYRFADDDPRKMEALARGLVTTNPDVIFVASRPLVPSMARATSTVPIIFISLGDPIAEGWVKSYSRPGGNLTGVAGLSPDLAGKRVELLRELVPTLTKVAVLWNTNNPGEEITARAIRDVGPALGTSVGLEPAEALLDLDRALANIVQSGAQAVIVLPDPSFQAERARIVDLIARHRLPTIYTESAFVLAGGLMSYSSSLADLTSLRQCTWTRSWQEPNHRNYRSSNRRNSSWSST